MTSLTPMRLHWLDPRRPREPFPDVEKALSHPNGLLAIGGDLTVTRLLQAYQHGIFPWFNPDEPILWWSPDPRTVIKPSELHVSRRLQRELRRGDYRVSLDTDFSAVMHACATARPEGTWLGTAMQAAYSELHRRGYAHSIEVWRDKELIGGLYGVALGRIFFGESMFSRASNGSKLAMVWLCRQLAAWGFVLLDCQVDSPHLSRLGAVPMPRRDFSQILASQTTTAPQGSWRFTLPDAPTAP